MPSRFGDSDPTVNVLNSAQHFVRDLREHQNFDILHNRHGKPLPEEIKVRHLFQRGLNGISARERILRRGALRVYCAQSRTAKVKYPIGRVEREQLPRHRRCSLSSEFLTTDSVLGQFGRSRPGARHSFSGAAS
jgi:hypothetical protein